ncbi:1-aminocyclopropane-1-carboxylate synthase-like protein 1 [Protopterus annectens]|uniref:1-aminocyclopropane-1-carboxylate synthase-like protein 1 n=1 Tax=Protopterus annectens TaxID=7888 RepID=UPI001CFBAC4D|nr:1-aminocyclopropane-1-carboxylate synthase-like protein 1 [Protopterus annectens]
MENIERQQQEGTSDNTRLEIKEGEDNKDVQDKTDVEHYLSSRGLRISQFRSFNEIAFIQCLNDPFDKQRNPKGALNMGLSENKICYDVIAERVSKIIMGNMEPEALHYADHQGIKSFREEIANFLTEQTASTNPVNADHVIVMNGCCSVFATLATALFDPGDGYLIPTPSYCGVYPQMCKYADLRPVHVPLQSKAFSGEIHAFQLTIQKLEDALQIARVQNIRVRALVLLNPNNPLGTIYSQELLLGCLQFAHRLKLHVIIDEMYMLSIHDDTPFTSVLSLKEVPDPQRLHYIWGFSKDFAMGGFRCGVLFTMNKEVKTAVTQLAVFHQCPVLVQHILTQLLFDKDWINCVYLVKNKKRLGESYRLMFNGLAALGVPVLKSSAGLFVWADFRKFLSSPTFEAEEELWQSLVKAKVFISPGKSYGCCEPGWFRIVCSFPKEVISIGLQRLHQGLQAHSQECGFPALQSKLNRRKWSITI